MERKKPNISYFHIFGSECFILNTKDKLSKFDPKSDPSIFLGYSSMFKPYEGQNKKTQTMEKTIHISFKEKKKDIDQNDRDLERDMENLSLNNDCQNQESLQVATRQNNDDSESPYLQHVYDNIVEESEESLIKKRCIGARDLRVVSQNQIVTSPILSKLISSVILINQRD